MKMTIILVASGSTHDKNKKYWLQYTEEYNDVAEVGPEVSSSMVSEAKSFGRSH